MPISLTTNRLLLKTPALSDFDDLYIFQTDPEVMHYIYGRMGTREQVKKELEAAIPHQEKHGFSLCSVIEKDSGKFIRTRGFDLSPV